MKRYTATIQLYIYAEDDEGAVQEACKTAEKMDERNDNKAHVTELHHTPFGSLESREIFIKNK